MYNFIQCIQFEANYIYLALSQISISQSKPLLSDRIISFSPLDLLCAQLALPKTPTHTLAFGHASLQNIAQTACVFAEC